MAPLASSARLIPAVVCVIPMGAALFLSGCDEAADANVAKVNLGGKTFYLEIVDDDEKRYKGLSFRKSIEENGGMLFVFPNSKVQVQGFVMRDCPIDIDIIFLDSAGRILKMHEMKPEPERGPNERAEIPEEDARYNERLPRYSSKFPSQFVIELKGGTLRSLNLKEGDLVKQRWEELKRRAK